MSGRGALILALVLLSGCGRVDDEARATAMRVLVGGEAPAWTGTTSAAEQTWATQQTFYEHRAHAVAWIDGRTLAPHAEALIAELHEAPRHGLDPGTYRLTEIEALLEGSRSRLRGVRLDEDLVPELDARLTYAYLRYAADLLGVSTDSREVDRNWVPRSRDGDQDLAAHLEAALDAGTIGASLEQFAPAHPQYARLQAALDAQQDEDRREQIRMNLERWRWAPRNLGEQYVLVNVPAYRLQVVDGDRAALEMRVVVGAKDTPTPIFSDRISYVVFSPYWNIPDSILRDETLPRVVEDPGYLQRSQIEVLRDGEVIDPADVDWSDDEALKGLRFRQVPGPENALGLVKFIFPNRFSVYLHDTPSTAHFARDERALSHGCVRVEKPVELAKYVLRDQPAWTERRIHDAMDAQQEQIAKLPDPLPVHIGYWTVWVDDDGAVQFLDDPYGLDRRHAKVRAALAAAHEDAPTE